MHDSNFKKIVKEFDFLTIFINITTAIAQCSPSSSFNILFIYLFVFLPGVLLLINWLNRRRSTGKFSSFQVNYYVILLFFSYENKFIRTRRLGLAEKIRTSEGTDSKFKA